MPGGACQAPAHGADALPRPAPASPAPLPGRQYREACRAIAAQHGCATAAQHPTPFTVILPARLIAAMLEEGGEAAAVAANSEADAEAEAEAAAGSSGSSSSGGSSGVGSVAEQLAELRGSAPIWQQPPLVECYAAGRGAAKALAKQLAKDLRGLQPAGAA